MARRTSPPRVGHEISLQPSTRSRPGEASEAARPGIPYIKRSACRVTLNLGRFGTFWLRPVRARTRCPRAPEVRDYPTNPFRPTSEALQSVPSQTSSSDATRSRVQAVVALRLLEVMRTQDVPPELLEEEDTAVTLPRRLGLSDVVDRQIRSFRKDARRGVRLSDTEIQDLFRLVIRRPDAEDIFDKAGRSLAGRPGGSWRRMLPGAIALALARGRVRRRLARLFGRRIGGFARGGFLIEGRSLLFIEADPGGDACALVTGLCQTVIEGATGRRAVVRHTLCQSRGDAVCRWEGQLQAQAGMPEAVLVLTPEPPEERE